MIFKMSRTVTRPNTNVQFYALSAEENAIYDSIPYFLTKTEELSEDGLTLTKTWEFDVGFEIARLDEIYNNEDLMSLNQKVYEYCINNEITRGELKGSFYIGDELVSSVTYPERP